MYVCIKTHGNIKLANIYLHLVTMPSTQTRFPRNRALRVRGETCLFPKLPSKPTWNSSNCLAYVASIEATKSFRALWNANSSLKAFFRSLLKIQNQYHSIVFKIKDKMLANLRRKQAFIQKLSKTDIWILAGNIGSNPTNSHIIFSILTKPKQGYWLLGSLFIPSPQVINVDDKPRLALRHHTSDFLMIHTLVLLWRYLSKVRSVLSDRTLQSHCFSEATTTKKDVERQYNCPWWVFFFFYWKWRK